MIDPKLSVLGSETDYLIKSFRMMLNKQLTAVTHVCSLRPPPNTHMDLHTHICFLGLKGMLSSYLQDLFSSHCDPFWNFGCHYF